MRGSPRKCHRIFPVYWASWSVGSLLILSGISQSDVELLTGGGKAFDAIDKSLIRD